MKYLVIISKNTGGNVDFSELITKITSSREKAEDFVLTTINPMINKHFVDIEALSEHLIYKEDEYGYTPLFDIREIEEDNPNDTVLDMLNLFYTNKHLHDKIHNTRYTGEM